MKSLLLILSVLIFSSFASAFSSSASTENTCRMKIQGGGVEGWPWAIAQPWRDIQGIWKLNSDEGEVFFKFRITATQSKRKILVIDKIIDGNCAKPVASGVGYIATEERNAVRAVISDKNVRYQLKLAVFDTQDLSSTLLTDAVACGQQVIGISVLQVIGRFGRHYETPKTEDGMSQPMENMMLKKVSSSLDSICKKPAGRH